MQLVFRKSFAVIHLVQRVENNQQQITNMFPTFQDEDTGQKDTGIQMTGNKVTGQNIQKQEPKVRILNQHLNTQGWDFQNPLCYLEAHVPVTS